MGRLFLDITYDIKKDEVTITSDIKEEKRAEIISEFLLSQVGAGRDNSEANNRDEYHIRLELDLTDDTFYCQHDTGNLGLRNGILMHVIKKLG